MLPSSRFRRYYRNIARCWSPAYLQTFRLTFKLTCNNKKWRSYFKRKITGRIINYAINEFLVSLAQDQKEKAIAIILAGMDDDGSEGVRAISDNGGVVLIQDPVSTDFKSMPIAAICSDHPDQILSPEQLGSRLLEVAQARKISNT